MSWDEQKWTVDQVKSGVSSDVQTKLNTLRTNVKNDVNTTITSNDSGKDLYKMGIERGSVLLSVSRELGTSASANDVEYVLVDVTGSGWVTSLSATNKLATSTNHYYPNTNTIAILDDTQVLTCTARNGGGTTQSSATISINQDLLTVATKRGLNLTATNGTITYNMPFRFNNRLKIIAKVNDKGVNDTSSVLNSKAAASYVLD